MRIMHFLKDEENSRFLMRIETFSTQVKDK